MIAEGLLSRIYLACLRYLRKGSFLCSVDVDYLLRPVRFAHAYTIYSLVTRDGDIRSYSRRHCTATRVALGQTDSAISCGRGGASSAVLTYTWRIYFDLATDSRPLLFSRSATSALAGSTRTSNCCGSPRLSLPRVVLGCFPVPLTNARIACTSAFLYRSDEIETRAQ